MSRYERVGFALAGLLLIAVGVFLFWKGWVTPPGEPAIRIPRREDWSATEAKVIGSVSCALGVYVAGFLGRSRRPK